MYYLEPNLSKICMIALAKYLWDIEAIKTKIKIFYIEQHEEETWYEITKSVLDYSDLILVKLPAKLKTEVADAIVFIGEEIHAWKQYLVKKLKLDIAFGDEVYFTPFGRIDESQIFKKFWMKNEELFKNDNIKYNLFDLGCLFVQKEFVVESKNGIMDNMQMMCSKYLADRTASRKMKELKVLINKLEKKDDVIFVLLSNWINVQFNHKYYEFDSNLNVKQVLDLKTRKYQNGVEEIEQSIMPLCFDLDLTQHLKYFYKRASYAYKEYYNEFVILSARKNCNGKYLTTYERKNYLEIVLLVINEISNEQKMVMLSHHFETLLKWTLKYWPYQGFFLRILNFSTCAGFISKTDWKKYLMLVAMRDYNDFLSGCPVKRNTWRLIFKDIWGRARDDIKENLSFFSKLFKIFSESLNFLTLKLLIDFNGDYEVVKKFFLFKRQIKHWLCQENNEGFVIIEKFFQEAFDDDEKRELFKRKLKEELIPDLISSGKMLELKKFTEWLSSSNENELELIKKEIDGTRAVESMVEYGKSHLIKDLLNWLYGSQDKIPEVINHLRSEEFSKNYIFNKFRIPHPIRSDQMKEHFTSFLNFICDTEEQIKNFKLNLLKDEYSILDFALACDEEYYQTDSQSNFFPIKNLTDFCELPEEKIEELKTKCIDNIEKLMDLFTSKCQSFIVMDHVINWLVKTNGRRQRLIKKLMKTPAAVQLCNKMLNLNISLDDSLSEIVLRFYNKWVKSCKNIPDIKKQLEEMNREKLTEADKTKLSAMFDKLEKGENLVFKEVLCYVEDDDEFDMSERSEDDDDYNYSSDDDSEDIDSPDGYLKDIFAMMNGTYFFEDDSD